MAKVTKREIEVIIQRMQEKAQETIIAVRGRLERTYSNRSEESKVKSLKKKLDKLEEERRDLLEELGKVVSADATTIGYQGQVRSVSYSDSSLLNNNEEYLLKELKKNTISANLPKYDFSRVEGDIILGGIGGDFNAEEFINGFESYLK